MDYKLNNFTTSAIATSIAEELMKRKEEVVKKAITAYLGTDNWTPAEIKERVQWVIIQSSGVEYIVMDGITLITFFPVEWMSINEEMKYFLEFNLHYREHVH